MCVSCGCPEASLIEQFVAEHEAVTDLAAVAAEALRDEAVHAAHDLLARLAHLLGEHWQGEEEGLFVPLRGDQAYTEYVDELTAEHRALGRLLESADVRRTFDRQHLLTALDGLRLHVAKEEDGLFPVALTALTGAQWDAAFDAWFRAHPAEPASPAVVAAL
jgi:iron-sulfur cluster repair protein YtfE (RIC family)